MELFDTAPTTHRARRKSLRILRQQRDLPHACNAR
jgi:hypothetical protein